MSLELDSLLQEEADKLEKKRKKLRTFHYLHILFVDIPSKLILVGIVVTALIGVFIFPVLLYTLFGLIVFIALKMIPVPFQKYNAYIKEQVLPKLFKHINPTFEYYPDGLNMD